MPGLALSPIQVWSMSSWRCKNITHFDRRPHTGLNFIICRVWTFHCYICAAGIWCHIIFRLIRSRPQKISLLCEGLHNIIVFLHFWLTNHNTVASSGHWWSRTDIDLKRIAGWTVISIFGDGACLKIALQLSNIHTILWFRHSLTKISSDSWNCRQFDYTCGYLSYV